MAVGRFADSIRLARSRASYRPWAPRPIQFSDVFTPASASFRVTPVLAVAARGEPEGFVNRVAENPIRAVPELQQVAGRECSTRDVIAARREGLDNRRCTSTNTTGTRRGREAAAVSAEGGSEMTSRPSVRASAQRREVVVPLLDRLDVVDHQVELAVREDRIHAAEALGGLGASQERDDHADGQRPSETQAPGSGLGLKPKSCDHVQDPLTRCSVDHLAAVHGSRRGRNADACLAGDVSNRDGFSGYAVLRGT